MRGEFEIRSHPGGADRFAITTGFRSFKAIDVEDRGFRAGKLQPLVLAVVNANAAVKAFLAGVLLIRTGKRLFQ